MRALCSAKKKAVNDPKKSHPKLTVRDRSAGPRTKDGNVPPIPALKWFEPSLAAAEGWEPGAWEDIGKIKWIQPGRVPDTAGETPRCSTSEKFRETQNIPQEARGSCESVKPA